MAKKTQKDDINDAIYKDLFGNTTLTLPQQKFILYYLESLNTTQSYLKATGRQHSSKAVAAVMANKWLNNKEVQLELHRLKKIMQRGFDIDPTRYVEFQLKGANADIGDYIKFSEEEVPVLAEDGSQMFDPDTGEKLTKKINRMHLVDSDTVDTSVITGIKQGRDGITINMVDKLKCWENLKEIFEWKVQKKKEEKQDNTLLEAINNSVNNSWNDNEDLDEDWRTYGNKK